MTDSDIEENQNEKTRKPFASYGVKFLKRLPFLIQSAMTSAKLLQIQSFRTLQFKF